MHPLDFVIGDFADEKAVPVAVLTTVNIDGRRCSVQLDTGASRAFILHDRQEGPATSSVTVELGSLQSTHAVPDADKRRLAECRPGKPVASLGNAFFDRRTVVFDFAAHSLSVHDAATLQDDPQAQPFRYAPWWGAEGGFILIRVLGTRHLPSEALLDTGALRVDLGVLDAATWAAIADTQSPSATPFSLPSWGRLIQCTKVAAKWPFVLAQRPAAKPTLSYCPELAFQPFEPILGILGMRRFLDGAITIDFISHRWRAPLPMAASPGG
ncbi:MAG TPA: hypothetical protein VIN58_10390 [Roseateles sp.]